MGDPGNIRDNHTLLAVRGAYYGLQQRKAWRVVFYLLGWVKTVILGAALMAILWLPLSVLIAAILSTLLGR